jgi:hypothetical protein
MGALDLWAHVHCDKHKKAVRGEMSSTKVASVFTALGSKSDYAVLAAKGVFAFHIVKCHGSYKTVDWTAVLFRRIFPDSEISHKFSDVQTRCKQS